MKKVYFKSILLAAVAVFSFSTFSCDIGMGEAVDLEAPEVSVTKMVAYEGGAPTSPKTNFATTLFTKDHVTFYGTAYDNTGVKNVHAEVKWLGEDDYTFLKNADLSGEDWVLDLKFEKEGACWLKIVSEDNKKNYGTKSAKVITLFVDNNAPAGDAWYIDRLVNGIQYNLQTKEALKKILEDDPNLLQPSNIDVAQNVKFNICSSFKDASGISTVSVSLYTEEGNKICELTKTNDSSNYAPVFVVDASKIPNLPSNGDHLIQVKYSATDIVSPNSNSVIEKEIDMGWFLWWPEMDKPRCYIPQESAGGNINLHINDALNVTVFDDDGFKAGTTVKCVLKDADNRSSTFEYTPTTGERQCNIKVDAPGDAQTMTLVTTATDVSGKSLSKTNPVLVTDDNHPTLIIESPENNQVPSVDSSSLITFKGITLDSSGCTNLKFVWVPANANVADKKEAALELLNGDSSSAPSSAVEVVTKPSGLKFYNVKLSAPTDEGGLKKQTFSFTQSLKNDFLINDGGNSVIDNNEKYFYIRLIRKDGNYTDSELKLSSDTIKPEIKLIGRGNMSLVDKDTPLVLKFRAKKANGVEINKDKYKIVDDSGNELTGSYNANEVAYVETDGSEVKGVYTADAVTKEKLDYYYNRNINPKYTFYAEDILGNSVEEDFQFIISALPQIKSISSSAPELCKIEPIRINVSFTKPVSISDISGIYLKLKKIKKNGVGVDSVRKAPLVEAQGTTLIFQYDVEAGDTSDGLEVFNESGKGPIEGIPETTAHIKDLLESGQNLQDKKTIKIDGIAPVVSNIVVTTDAEPANKESGYDYLKEGRTVTAKVTVSKKVTVQGTPTFKMGDLVLDWQEINSTGTVLTFKKKIKKGEAADGSYGYTKNSCIAGLDIIKDTAGNGLVNNLTGDGTEKVKIDTTAPEQPEINNVAKTPAVRLAGGKYMEKVLFKIDNAVQSLDPAIKTEYSLDGGTTWTLYSDFGTTNGTAPASKEILASSSVVSATLVARITDRAGNVSEYSDPISLEINNAFPRYTVECTNADKNYKTGKLTFKVYFDSPVNIANDATAYIALSGNSVNDVFAKPAHNAELVTKGKSNVSEATFEYTIQQGDSFTLNVAKDAVKLYGIEDLYGFTQNGLELGAAYSRPNLRCDNVPPKVLTMTPGEKENVYTGKNIYKNGKVIVLGFNEPVKVNTGKIYLRQTAGWAIPPMFNLSEFNKVLSAVKAAGNVGNGTLTGTTILYMDGREDVEGPLFDTVGPANYTYHGTGQFIGPYKKTSQGLNADGKTPNYKDTKYVLDYDMDIWGDAGKKFGTTFNTGNAARNDKVSQPGEVVVKEGTTAITTANIRQVLESIHFHERYVSVNSAAVVVGGANKNEVTITFPDSFLGESALQPGLEWELVVEKGAFMDETGNLFGGTEKTDSRQATNGSNDVSKTWSRVRTGTVTDPLVLIQDGANPSFLSSGVAKPVIRVDRYSYGLGIYQPKMENGAITRSFVQTVRTEDNFYGSQKIIPTIPTAKVRVRIDSQTKDAVIRHAKTNVSKVTGDATVDNGGVEGVTSYASESFTDLTLPTAPASATAGNGDVEFLSGSGDHKKSYIELIYAKAFFNGQSSDVEKEGVFQTVLCMVNPVFSGGRSIFEDVAGWNDVSVRGTTGWAGEPSISPFPLRDSAIGSPYLRRAYPDYYDGDNKNFYWISYEILIDSSVSMYSHGPKVSKCDWGKNWGLMQPGEFNRIHGFENWQ